MTLTQVSRPWRVCWYMKIKYQIAVVKPMFWGSDILNDGLSDWWRHVNTSVVVSSDTCLLVACRSLEKSSRAGWQCRALTMWSSPSRRLVMVIHSGCGSVAWMWRRHLTRFWKGYWGRGQEPELTVQVLLAVVIIAKESAACSSSRPTWCVTLFCRHLWDEDLMNWRVVEKLDKNTEIFQYVVNSMAPHPTRDICELRYSVLPLVWSGLAVCTVMLMNINTQLGRWPDLKAGLDFDPFLFAGHGVPSCPRGLVCCVPLRLSTRMLSCWVVSVQWFWPLATS